MGYLFLTEKQEKVLMALEAYCRSYMADAWIGTWKEVMEMEADLDLLTHLEERGYIAPFRQMSGGFWWICPTRAHGEERDTRKVQQEDIQNILQQAIQIRDVLQQVIDAIYDGTPIPDDAANALKNSTLVGSLANLGVNLAVMDCQKDQ